MLDTYKTNNMRKTHRHVLSTEELSIMVASLLLETTEPAAVAKDI